MRAPRSIFLGGALAAAAVLGGTTLTAAADDTSPSEVSSSEAPSDVAGHGWRDQALAAFDELRHQQYRAWADEDGAAFASTFTEDADMVTFNGEHLQTRDGIAEGMQYFFDNYIEPNTIELVDEDITFVGSKMAVIVRTTCLINQGDTECRDGSLSINTNVMVRRHGEWLQQSFQNTRVDPLP
jgi:uncharacterized protein (TIGR02246 family)